jgi:hypothetical protein
VASGTSALLWLDIHRPPERYVRPVITRGTSTVAGEIWAFPYNARDLPVNNVTVGTIAGLLLNDPEEGTA